jgi:hypothetical protein
VGRNENLELLQRYKEVTQVTWDQLLGFMWQRFNRYRRQKSDVHQWDRVGKRLKILANSSQEPAVFVAQIRRSIEQWANRRGL